MYKKYWPDSKNSGFKVMQPAFLIFTAGRDLTR